MSFVILYRNYPNHGRNVKKKGEFEERNFFLEIVICERARWTLVAHNNESESTNKREWL